VRALGSVSEHVAHHVDCSVLVARSAGRGSRERILPAFLGRVDGDRRTPWVAIVATTAITMVLIASGDLSSLADTTVLLLLVVFSTVNIAVLILRRDPVQHRHFRAPTLIPVIGVAVSVALMTTKDAETFARAGVLLAVGSGLWALNWWLHGRHVDPYDTAQLQAVESGEVS
jgi:amino acid transporter